jgi:uncharacterized protein (TIGR02996 family)
VTAAADPVAVAFLADIIANPGEDAPRLIYADWLDEHGEPDRAEFIRRQCQLAWLDAADVRYAAVRARAGDLFRGAWDAEVTPRHWPGSFAWPASVYRRGFIAEMLLPCADWLRHGPSLVRAAPLDTVRLSDREPGAVGPGVTAMGEAWWQTDGGWAAPTQRLPLCIHARLRTGQPLAGAPTKWFRDRPAALDALSAAALAWARATPPGGPPP